MDETDKSLPEQVVFAGNRKYVCVEGDCVNSDISQISINIIIKVWRKEWICYLWMNINERIFLWVFFGYIPKMFLCSSIARPSLVHRYSIETMDLLWSWYGVTMEYLRWNSEELASVNEENDDSLAFALFAWNCIFNFMCLAVLQSFLCKNGAWIVKIDIFRSFFQVFLWSFGKNQYLYTQFPQFISLEIAYTYTKTE